MLSAVFKIGETYHVWVLPSRCPRDYAPHVPDAVVHVQEDCPAPVVDAAANGATFVAHNAEQFDAPAWERFVPDVRPTWYDTLPCARAGGYPASIDALGEYLIGQGKVDKASAKLLFDAKVRAGKVVYPVGTAALWDKFLAYNLQDVRILAEVFERTRPYGEPDVLTTNAEVNERGIPTDLRLAAVVRDLWVEFQATARDEVEELTGGAITADEVRSIPKVRAWLRKEGLAVDTLNRAAIETLIADPDGFFGDSDDPAVARVLGVLLARQHACRATVGKVTRVFTAADPDGRIRGVHVAYGAHTGRFSSREFQSHNMAKGMLNLDVEGLLMCHYYATGTLTLAEVRAAAERAREPWQIGDPTGDALATLMRPIVASKKGLRIADYARIEAVAVAWLSSAENALAIFRDPAACIYCEQATAVYGRPITKKDKAERQLGKIMVLGLGYGMGANKFGTACRMNKPSVDLAAIGVTPDQCVKSYRETFPAVPAAWKRYERACRRALDGEIVTACRCTFYKDGRFLIIRLPSGRELRYRNARTELAVPRWGGPPRDAILYDGVIPGKTLYGGLIMENISQAVSRDIMAHSLVQLPGVVLHVHDEIVTEEGDIADICRKMSTPPPWAEGFPLRVEGFTAPHYVKSPFSTSEKADAINGELI